MASGGATGKSKNRSINLVRRRYPYLAVCVANRGNEISLQIGKAYKVIQPLPNDPPRRIRVIDEDGEDYLYLPDWFVAIDVAPAMKRRIMEAVSG